MPEIPDAILNGHDQSPAPNPQPRADRAAINRANAQHSTGPRTEAGKKHSSLNALRHGLTGHVIVMPGEDLAAYQRFTKGFFDEHQPKTDTESTLVQTIVDLSWKLNRLTALENNLLVLGMTEHADDVNTAHPEIHNALAMAKAYRDQSRMFANLGMHENRLLRERERTIKLLVELQTKRRENERWDLPTAARLLELQKKKGLPYNPREDGFVFSTEEIETYIRRHEHQKEAQKFGDTPGSPSQVA